MTKRVVAFVLMFMALLSVCVIGVSAYSNESKYNVDANFSASLSDSYGKLYTTQINSVMKTDNTNYYSNCKFVDGQSLKINYNSSTGAITSIQEVDYNMAYDADRRVVAYYSTETANAVVSVGKIYNGSTIYTGTFKDYLLICRNSSSVPYVPSTYY